MNFRIENVEFRIMKVVVNVDGKEYEVFEERGIIYLVAKNVIVLKGKEKEEFKKFLSDKMDMLKERVKKIKLDDCIYFEKGIENLIYEDDSVKIHVLACNSCKEEECYSCDICENKKILGGVYIRFRDGNGIFIDANELKYLNEELYDICSDLVDVYYNK